MIETISRKIHRKNNENSPDTESFADYVSGKMIQELTYIWTE